MGVSLKCVSTLGRVGEKTKKTREGRGEKKLQGISGNERNWSEKRLQKLNEQAKRLSAK